MFICFPWITLVIMIHTSSFLILVVGLLNHLWLSHVYSNSLNRPFHDWCDTWIISYELNHPYLSEWLIVSIRTKYLNRHFSSKRERGGNPSPSSKFHWTRVSSRWGNGHCSCAWAARRFCAPARCRRRVGSGNVFRAFPGPNLGKDIVVEFGERF